MASVTKAQLAARALRKLGVLAAGETASAEDGALAETAVEAAYSEMIARRIIIYTPALSNPPRTDITLTSVNEYLADYLAMLGAVRIAPDFGMATVGGVDLEVARLRAEAGIRRMEQIKYIPPVDANEPETGDADYTGITEAKYF